MLISGRWERSGKVASLVLSGLTEISMAAPHWDQDCQGLSLVTTLSVWSCCISSSETRDLQGFSPGVHYLWAPRCLILFSPELRQCLLPTSGRRAGPGDSGRYCSHWALQGKKDRPFRAQTVPGQQCMGCRATGPAWALEKKGLYPSELRTFWDTGGL